MATERCLLPTSASKHCAKKQKLSLCRRGTGKPFDVEEVTEQHACFLFHGLHNESDEALVTQAEPVLVRLSRTSTTCMSEENKLLL